MDTAHTMLPHWDMTPIYPDLNSSEFLNDFAAVQEVLRDLVQYFDENDIAFSAQPPSLTADTVKLFEAVLTQFDAAITRFHLLYVYISSFIATDSRNDEAQTYISELMIQRVHLNKLGTRFTAWLGSLDIASLIEKSEIAKTHTLMLLKAQQEAQHLMSPEEETLAAELDLTGGKAWSKLYNNVTSQITVEVDINGEMQTLPMTAVRNLANDVDRSVRRNAYTAELTAWEAHAVPIAAALNSIKGQMNVLTERRKWEQPLDVALFNNNIPREVLDVMLETSEQFYPTFRRYLKAKAKALQVENLAWYDLFAPVGRGIRTWEFDAAQNFIIDEFEKFSPRLGQLARRAFQEHWIDAEPRDGKGGGAFCMWVRKDESRILSNFSPTYSGMETLAHELGHAYHNLARAQCDTLQRQTPMTLAETASNLCEIILRKAALKTAPPSEQMLILEAYLQGANQVVVDIASRFIFEKAVFEQRQQHELSVKTLNTLMLEAQRATYGDGLDPDALHPYMWAVKSHYYGNVFYNFPYMFGLLFSMGLYARYQEAPETFIDNYDRLLATTGMRDAVTLATQFDLDIREADFWQSSLELIAADIARFEQLVKNL